MSLKLKSVLLFFFFNINLFPATKTFWKYNISGKFGNKDGTYLLSRMSYPECGYFSSVFNRRY